MVQVLALVFDHLSEHDRAETAIFAQGHQGGEFSETTEASVARFCRLPNYRGIAHGRVGVGEHVGRGM
jgi:hypothetical protein